MYRMSGAILQGAEFRLRHPYYTYSLSFSPGFWLHYRIDVLRKCSLFVVGWLGVSAVRWMLCSVFCIVAFLNREVVCV